MKNKYGGEGKGLIERGGLLTFLLWKGGGVYIRKGGGLNGGFMVIDKPMVVIEPTVHCSKHTAIRSGFEIISQQHASHAQKNLT